MSVVMLYIVVYLLTKSAVDKKQLRITEWHAN